MNAEVATIKTAAETALAHEFATARGCLPGDDAIAAQRKAAFDLFAKEGLPNRRIEEWKYTDLRALMRDVLPLAATPDSGALERAKAALASLTALDAHRLVLVDGVVAPALSDLVRML